MVRIATVGDMMGLWSSVPLGVVVAEDLKRFKEGLTILVRT